MVVDRCESSCARQRIIRAAWDVALSLCIPILLGEAEVDNIDFIATIADTYEEIAWLDITVNNVVRMDEF
jgi:hypothetical protein